MIIQLKIFGKKYRISKTINEINILDVLIIDMINKITDKMYFIIIYLFTVRPYGLPELDKY